MAPILLWYGDDASQSQSFEPTQISYELLPSGTAVVRVCYRRLARRACILPSMAVSARLPCRVYPPTRLVGR